MWGEIYKVGWRGVNVGLWVMLSRLEQEPFTLTPTLSLRELTGVGKV